MVLRPSSGPTAPLAALWASALPFLPAAALAQGPATATAADTVSDWRDHEVLAAQGFVVPPDPIAEAALAPRWLNVELSDPSPDGAWFLDEVGDGPIGMDTFSTPFHELGGLFVDYRANRDRRLTIRNNAGIDLYSATDGSKVPVQVPDGARISNATWSPDGSEVAYFAHFDDATHIFVAEAATGMSRRITPRPVLATLTTDFQWTAGGAAIATVLVPADRAPMPTEPAVPVGPQVKITEEGDNRLRTYASLMETPHHEALLEWHATGQFALIDVDSGEADEIGEPAMVRDFDVAPGGDHAVVTRMVRPFSYVVPVSRFGEVAEIWSRDGAVMAVLDTTALDTGIRDDDDDGAENGDPERRQLAWRPDGRGLTFLQMEPRPDSSDAGDDLGDDVTEREEGEGRGAGRMDRVMLWRPPFDESSIEVVHESETRMQSHAFDDAVELLFVTERQGERVHQYVVDLDDSGTRYSLARWSEDDFYDRPGTLVASDGSVSLGGSRWRRRGSGGGPDQTILTSDDGESVYYAGARYAEDPMATGPRTFVDRVDIRSGEKERIYESPDQGVYEAVSTVIDPEAGIFVFDRESPTEVPQSFRLEGGRRVQLTDNVDYTPDLTHAPVERFVVTRPDGFRFRVTVTLPPGYEEGTRLPAMFWFYPREYDDQESYDERARTFNKNAFPNFGTRSMEYLVRLGYAVVEPDAPIVGPEGRMNDNYEHDLRNNLAAVIDELDARELIDRRRLGLGGHSYGAFSTVNAMVHTPFFKAGIAGDGNYNRTLTPMSFQNERRLLWEARDVYMGMSPFMYANNLTGALLMYHGLQDQNVGTHPSHAPRLFHALNGLDKDAAMYLYPFEDHGPATRETILDLWARWTAWLEVHLSEDEGARPVTFD